MPRTCSGFSACMWNRLAVLGTWFPQKQRINISDSSLLGWDDSEASSTLSLRGPSGMQPQLTRANPQPNPTDCLPFPISLYHSCFGASWMLCLPSKLFPLKSLTLDLLLGKPNLKDRLYRYHTLQTLLNVAFSHESKSWCSFYISKLSPAFLLKWHHSPCVDQFCNDGYGSNFASLT